MNYIKDPVYSDVDLFDMEIKYLHDDRFRVLAISNLKYDMAKTKLSIYINDN